MTSLFHSLNIGSQSLYATKQGIDTTAHNIANAQTDGYSRQDMNLVQRDPTNEGNVIIGNGVFVGDISRTHDKYLEKQMNNTNSAYGESEARSKGMKELEGLFNPELTSTLSQELSGFFSSLQTLASYPEELTARTTVREQGINLVDSFHRVDTDLKRCREDFNQRAKASTEEVNNLMHGIASLNLQVRQLEVGSSAKANDLRDQKDRMVEKLAEKIHINYYEDQYGMSTIRGAGDVLLVDRGKAATLRVQRNGLRDGMYDIFAFDSEGSRLKEISQRIDGGELKAMLEMRDVVTKTLIDQNNDLAWNLMHNFNDIHREGFGIKDFSESVGRNFFNPVENKNLAAQEIQLDLGILNNTDSISCGSTPNAPGDNVIVNRLLDLKNEKIMGNKAATMTEYYANCVGVLGIEALRTQHILESDKILLADIKSRKEAVSGVSLDEEATNMIKWHSAFTASSKIITTIDEMMETVLSLKR